MKQVDNVVLSINKVSKSFLLPHEKNSSIKSNITSIFKKRNKTVEVQHALRDISFDIKKGEFFGILGRNGSGKSTMLKILAEIYKPTTGTVSTHGKLVPFIELGVGFNPELTGRENVYLNGALLGFSRSEIDSRYDEIVEFAELEEFMDQKLKNYSSGMQVRLAFSVATRAEADILLVDEVLAVGDADFQRKCYNFFKSLKKNNKTVIFVSHDMNAVREFCDRAILIKDGVIAKQGDANVIANEYMKLFNPSTQKEDSQDSRWGSGDIKLFSPRVKCTLNEVVFNLTLKTKLDIATDVVIGLRIKDASGKVVAGFNTQQLNRVVNVSALNEKKIEWRIANIFSSASYSVDATVRSADSTTIYDNWDSLLSFDVQKAYHSPYSISPDSILKEIISDD